MSLSTVLTSTTRTVPRTLHILGNHLLRSSRSSAGSISARRTFITIVTQGSEAQRLSFGRNPKTLQPGLNLYITIYHSIVHVDMRERSVQIADLLGFTADNVPVTLSGSLFYKVNNSHEAVFKVDDYKRSVERIGTSAMRSIIGQFNYDDVIDDRNRINRRLQEIIGDSIQTCSFPGLGTSMHEAGTPILQTFEPRSQVSLERQMEAERNRRKQLLDTQAAVNVAEGHKQRVVLESEGAYQAKLNEAEGLYRSVVREAEARKEERVLEGKAFGAMVEEIAKSLSSGERQVVGEKERKAALEAVLELRRIEQLKAIAAGQGNSTYFLGSSSLSEGSGKSAYDVDNAETWKQSIRRSMTSAVNTSPVGAQSAIGT